MLMPRDPIRGRREGGARAHRGECSRQNERECGGIGVRRETQGKQPTGALSAVAKTTDSGPAPWSEVRIQAEAAG